MSATISDPMLGRSFGDYLRARRVALGIGQQTLADAMGLTVSRYSAIEMGMLRRIPTPSQISGIASALRVSPVELLEAAGYTLTGAKA